MKIVAHVGVMDEVELVERCLEQLFAIGVDEIVVTDMGSTDGSLELLRARSDRHRLRLVECDERDPATLREWAPRVTALVKEARADWALFLDADELLLPRDGDLRRCASLTDVDLLCIDRFNVPLSADGLDLPQPLPPSFYGQLDLVVDPVPDLHLQVDATPPVPWSRGVPLPKVMVRPRLVSMIGIGGHEATPREGARLRSRRPADLVIAHLPFTTRGRFEAKAANIARALAADESFFEGIAWHWKRWVAALARGEIDEEFERQVFTPEMLARLRAEGAVESVAQWFARRKHESTTA
jgi:glycosyltransferase involved in cell wall biosynthesis